MKSGGVLVSVCSADHLEMHLEVFAVGLGSCKGVLELLGAAWCCFNLGLTAMGI